MTMKKVNLAYITNDSKRRRTFKKRKTGLIKKINEISTLCGIESCAIIFGENDVQPEVWPSKWGVQKVLSRFRRCPEMEQRKKMFDQESYLRQKIQKAQEQLKKQKNENKRKEMTHLMFQCLEAGKICDNVGLSDLNNLSWLIDQNLKQIDKKIDEDKAKEVVENGEGSVNGGRREEGMENNVDPMQTQQNWSLGFTNNNVNVGEVLPFENGNNVPNGLWP